MQASVEAKALTLYMRAALKECIEYGEHGDHVEINEDGKTICLNCEGEV